MNSIKLFIVEEHHEAFIAWHYSIKNKFIKKKNNILLHIDYHADMDLPILIEPLIDENSSLEKIADYTYKELSIADFIAPAVFQGIFNKVYWLSHEYFSRQIENIHYTIRSLNNERKLFSLKQFNKEAPLPDSFDYKKFQYRKLTLLDQYNDRKDIVLDIDLDFFSCNKIPMKYSELEITREEYERFVSDRYHFMKLITTYKIKSLIKNNRHYLVINDLDKKINFGLEATNEKILERIKILSKFLADYAINPSIITICRSRYSNYTPDDQWEFIENNLLNTLSINFQNIEKVNNFLL